VIVLAVIGMCVYFGYQTGIVASIFYILSGFVGLFMAQKYCPEPNINFYLVFAASAVCVIIIGFLIGKIFNKLLLGTLDRLGGVILGMILGIVMVGVVVFPISYHMPQSIHNKVTQSFSGSKFIPFFQRMFPKMQQFKLSDIKESLPEIKLPDFKSKKK